jgi:uncharacterized protein
VHRIRRAYEAEFRNQLRQLGARRIDAGVRQLFAQAGGSAGPPPTRALLRIQERLEQAGRRLAARTSPRVAPASAGRDGRPREPAPPTFLCDAGLGGLARWLRAAGHPAAWDPRVEDHELVQRALAQPGILLTTDSLLMERQLVRDCVVTALWLPPVLTIQEQLRLVFRRFGLSLREPRCMRCGGPFRPVAKEAVWERIPPKTRQWLDHYFECPDCRQLFWHGTHWQRIRGQLLALETSPELRDSVAPGLPDSG